MNAKRRKQIAALNLDEVIEVLDDVLTDEEGVDGLRGHYKSTNALRQAIGALSDVQYFATTPRKDWK